MSHQHKALQRHIDIPKRDEHAPVISSIRKNGVGGKEKGKGDQRQTPNYADVGNETMTPDLILMYRARIASGVYDAPATINALAEALLHSSDL